LKVTNFYTSKNFLASLCDDGNVYIWSINGSESENKSGNNDSFQFSFIYSIHSTPEIGMITDCKILDINMEYNNICNRPASALVDSNSSDLYNMNTIAICTSFGYIKIYNIENKSELFSMRLFLPENQSNPNNSFSKLNKLFYSLNYIITIDTSGYVFFLSLQQLNSPLNHKNNEKSSFPSHKIKLSSNCLRTLCIFKESIICIGDSDGYIYLLSIFDI
jgi:WD40 repeat protein